MKKIASLKYAQNQTNQNSFVGIHKKQLVSKLYKVIDRYTKGFYSDESWNAVHQIFKEFDKLNLDWNLTDNFYGNQKYDHTMPPEKKQWKFEIDFINDRGNPDKIYGTIVASGGGSVEDPLEKYDVIVVMSQSKKEIKQAKWEDKIPGGKSDQKSPKDFDKDQLEKGKKIELEHTDDEELATEIVMDHLEEAGDLKGKDGAKYYDLLEDMEKRIEKKLETKNLKGQK